MARIMLFHRADIAPHSAKTLGRGHSGIYKTKMADEESEGLPFSKDTNRQG